MNIPVASLATHLELVPPAAKGTGLSVAAALLVHLLLMAALTWGISWNQTDNSPAVAAEIWSSLPQLAAPSAEPAQTEPVPADPAPSQPPPPQPAPLKPIELPTAAKPPPAKPVSDRDAEIATEKKKQAALEKKQALERLEAKKKAELKDKKEREDKVRQEREKKDMAAKDKTIKEQREQLDKLAKEKEQKEKWAKQSALDDKRLKAQHEEDKRRITGLAGAAAAPSAKGDTLRSSGPSTGYAGRLAALLKTNIRGFNRDDVIGNPATEVEVRTGPDGSILSRRITQSSGNKGWDEAVLKALDRTEVLPRDTDGSIPSPMLLSFRPRD